MTRDWARLSGRLTRSLVGLLLVACNPAGPGPPASPIATVGSPGGTAVLPGAIATIEPSISEASTSLPPSAVPSTTASPPGAHPPDASMVVDGGDPVVGMLGSYTWRNAGSNAPWLPGAPIHVGQGEELMVSLTVPVAIATWTAGRTTPGSLDGANAFGLAEGRGGLPRFLAPPPGTWSVQVVVWFAANQGSAAYYWLVEVD